MVGAADTYTPRPGTPNPQGPDQLYARTYVGPVTPTPVDPGDVWVNTGDGSVQFWNGTVWLLVSGGGGGGTPGTGLPPPGKEDEFLALDANLKPKWSNHMTGGTF